MREPMRDQRVALKHTSQAPLNATPPGAERTFSALKEVSSWTSKSSRPRGQLAKKDSERLEDNEQDRRDEDQHGKFVEHAEPDVALRVAPGGERLHQAPAPEVVGDEDRRHAAAGGGHTRGGR